MAHQPTTVHRRDYSAPDYLVDHVALHFDLHQEQTTVHARLELRRNDSDNAQPQPLRLNGIELELLGLALDGVPLTQEDYRLDAESLTIERVPSQCTLEVITRIRPQENMRLEGLYRSGAMFCTQCEAQGFRRITFFLDRPDVMARFTTTIEADRDRYPVLLSNGNQVAQGQAAGNRHWVRWEDPFPKPSYLFALVAGDLACHEDRHVTASGRTVRLRIFTERENLDKTEHAMACLQAAMRWDEATYDLECDLNDYMIVAVGDFNMGAMENKGLNIFNTQYILARPETATDSDYEDILAVVGHEYFHNWTGNRVTLRDWFQLSLKEGLTVFREQQFTAAMGAAAVKRIQEVRGLRAAQFPEDAGPMAHSVRPDKYVEINNFYTATVYMKGAEVIRMYHSLLGQEGFCQGLALYLQRHDGQAVTCRDFLMAMAEANGIDLEQFGLWYSQAGTPCLEVHDEYEPGSGRYTLHIRQHTPATPGQPHKQPLHIPVIVGLLNAEGHDLPLRLENETQAITTGSRVLELRHERETFRFLDIPQRPIPSLLRGFSAPVKLDYAYTEDQLAFLFGHDSDEFNRWEAGQQLSARILLRWVNEGRGSIPERFRTAFRRTLCDTETDPALLAEALALPSENFLAEQMKVIDVEGIHIAREAMRCNLAEHLSEELRARYALCVEQGNKTENTAAAAGYRRLKNAVLGYLATLQNSTELQRCLDQYATADNMTDALAALALLVDSNASEAEASLADFYRRWQHEPLVVDKWLRVQALSSRSDTLARVIQLTAHPAFDIRNPNKVRSLLGAFAQGNPACFHDVSGAGYTFLADRVLELDGINPQVAARLVTPLSRWGRHDPRRSSCMHQQLERIYAQEGLSKDVYEIVARSLDRAVE
ncbi:aminopeptidase N [Nitrococcus mobilis]|uniref:Aminopeptidase N n=1 Tax=Nitrococcus mobilis Nb-231 TaxID=314278 RepID=A4BS61_9GAMM|nr:aminopeptidase N [Nitrococcus mobilis]EAR21540.1 Peptidase M, neutral zinc metallopeptidase, zinc-binding site [Nitrococcus mobilis Nb-231]